MCRLSYAPIIPLAKSQYTIGKSKKHYEPKFRFSFSPRSAVVMGAPSGNYNRVANLGKDAEPTALVQMHGGEISSNAARKIRNAIDWLIASASEKYVYSKKTKRFHKWKLSFLTLTLPTQGRMNDIEVKSILNSFLTLAKYNYGLHSYIWKAEPQARGVIHFHLTSDCYMWKNSVRFEWNRLLSKSGLLNNQPDAPSTKIHSTYKLSNVAAYLSKYFLKPKKISMPPEKNYLHGLPNYYHSNKSEVYSKSLGTLRYIRPIVGRLWGCSHSLSQARSLSYTVDAGEMRSLNSEIREASVKEIQKQYCNYYQLPSDYYDNLTHGQLKHDYLAHVLKIRKKKLLHQYEIYSAEGEPITDKKIIRKFIASTKKT